MPFALSHSVNAQVKPPRTTATEMTRFSWFSHLRFHRSKWPVIAGCAAGFSGYIDLWPFPSWNFVEDSKCSLPFSPACINRTYSTRPNQIKTHLSLVWNAGFFSDASQSNPGCSLSEEYINILTNSPSVSLSLSPAGTVFLNWPKHYITNDGSEWMSSSFLLL